MKAIIKSSLMSLFVGSILAAAIPVLHVGCSSEPSSTAGGRDLIVVLDTSRSMIGQGGKNIFPQVKESLKKFIGEAQKGDSLTIMTFDESVKSYPTIMINDDNDKNIVGQMLGAVQADGMWTPTMGMLRNVFKTANELENKDKSRKQVIVMLTDGLDDPPPGRRGERFNIKDAAKSYRGDELYVYLVNFGDLKKNEKFKAVQAELQKSTGATVQVVEGGQSPSGAVQDVQQSLQQQREAERGFLCSPLFWVLIIILLLLALIWVLYMFSKIKVKGSLEYYNYTLLDPYVNTGNLGRYNLKEVVVGKTGADMVLRDFEGGKSFKIKAFREKGKIVNKILVPEGMNLEFVNRDAGEFLNNGDVFKVANYSFKFIAPEG